MGKQHIYQYSVMRQYQLGGQCNFRDQEQRLVGSTVQHFTVSASIYLPLPEEEDNTMQQSVHLFSSKLPHVYQQASHYEHQLQPAGCPRVVVVSVNKFDAWHPNNTAPASLQPAAFN